MNSKEILSVTVLCRNIICVTTLQMFLWVIKIQTYDQKLYYIKATEAVAVAVLLLIIILNIVL
jgi:hypothetical protein